MADFVELQIIDIAFGGAGVARRDSKVYFVPFTAVGDTVHAVVTKEHRKFVEAQVTEILEPSPQRVDAPCPYFGRCGGCAYQHLAYDAQLHLKQRQVEETLRRIGKFSDVPMRAIVPSPEPYGYRNRIRVHVDGGRAGFFMHRSHELIPIERCLLAQQPVNDELAALRRQPVRDGDYTLVARGGGDYFEQVNDGVAQHLLALVENSVTRGNSLLIDAYSGIGFFGHRLAPHFEQVIGVEENERAVARASSRAASNERHLVGDVAALLSEIVGGHAMDRTSVILDPPATGISPRVADILAASTPSEVLYVSCNPATLARDLATFRSGYRLESVTPLDMFPQTAEVEVLAVLRAT